MRLRVRLRSSERSWFWRPRWPRRSGAPIRRTSTPHESKRTRPSAIWHSSSGSSPPRATSPRTGDRPSSSSSVGVGAAEARGSSSRTPGIWPRAGWLRLSRTTGSRAATTPRSRTASPTPNRPCAGSVPMPKDSASTRHGSQRGEAQRADTWLRPPRPFRPTTIPTTTEV